ncbi:DNA-binding transcriptional MerR regulator [Nocardia neocaledoniensis]|uniref:DNA-binding transcriptional MerR regulator n=2 Tax=Nocardia neocaledoniensis TaxID=236511 RepID=A0A317P074_9NOCA|nr:DNA-binding transcriptional MerR regulator [Nocardia neocaledoniensis]
MPATVTDSTRWTIGELAARTGVAVRTIRFYCDEGLLDVGRTSAGHRVFDPAAVDRLLLLRRLRSFGIGLAAIGDVLAGARSVAEVVAAERAALDLELDALARRRSLLRAVEEGAPEQLNRLAAVADPTVARTALAIFWRRLLAPLPSEVIDDFVDMNVPEPAADADPEKVLAYAELVAAVADPYFGPAMSATIRHRGTPGVRDHRRLLLDVADACLVAAPLVAAGRAPAPGPALDRYVEVHAAARDRADTPSFRRQLLADAGGVEPARRYWRLTATIAGDAVTSGAAHLWLFDALTVSAKSEGEADDPASPDSPWRTHGTTSTMSPGSSQS